MKYCPKCKAENIIFDGIKEFRCTECGWNYFHNIAASAGVVILREGKVLLVKRAKNPGKGMYCLPGGFCDPNETAEETAIREAFEEIGVKPDNLYYIAAFPNIYSYKDYKYNTLDIYFGCEYEGNDFKIDEVEVEKIEFFDIRDLDVNILSFDSLKKLFNKLKNEYDSTVKK